MNKYVKTFETFTMLNKLTDENIGKEFWFEYHCFESPTSVDKELWYRTHQKILVLSIVESGNGNTKMERSEAGEPRVYNVKFLEDGYIGDVFEDELMNSREEFYRPDYKGVISESYLESGFAPIYHWTLFIREIMEDDELLISTPAYGEEGVKSISLTRSNYYGEYSKSGYTRLVLDVNKLKLDGYKILPIEEIALSKRLSYGIKGLKDFKYHKGFYHPMRYMRNKVELEMSEDGLEHEYEVRIFKNIKNLGKYLLEIQFTDLDDIEVKLDVLKIYLEKYSKIKITLINSEDPWKKSREINIFKFEKELK